MKNRTSLVTVPSRSSLRKHAFYGILALVSLLGLCMTQSAKANLITNGGFETGDTTGWSGFAEVVSLADGFSVHSGNYAAADQGATGVFAAQNVTTTPGASYVIDFWVAGEIGSGSIVLDVYWGGALELALTRTSDFDYTEYMFTVTGSQSATTTLEFDTTETSGQFFLDDVSVNSVPDAGSTLPLLGFASLGLVALRRKLRF